MWNDMSNMHHIQRSIIFHLSRTSPLRFSDLQPPRVPNNTFSYHLKKLIDNGYVVSTASGYEATRKALKTVAYGINNREIASSPKSVSMLFIHNSNDEVLLIKRNQKPFQEWYGLPTGLIHRNETLEEAAARELKEKTGVETNQKLAPAGTLDTRYIDGETDDIFMHTIGFLYKVELNDRPDLENYTTRYGQLKWSNLTGDNVLPEVYEAKKIIDKGKLSFKSVSLVEPDQLEQHILGKKPTSTKKAKKPNNKK